MIFRLNICSWQKLHLYLWKTAFIFSNCADRLIQATQNRREVKSDVQILIHDCSANQATRWGCCCTQMISPITAWYSPGWSQGWGTLNHPLLCQHWPVGLWSCVSVFTPQLAPARPRRSQTPSRSYLSLQSSAERRNNLEGYYQTPSLNTRHLVFMRLISGLETVWPVLHHTV